jgi:hypothetical protein
MNLGRALVSLFATIGTAAGFIPSGRVAFSLSSSHSSSSSRVAFAPRVRALLSEVVQATETSVAASSDEPVAESAFDATIYVGNISFGQFDYSSLLFASDGIDKSSTYLCSRALLIYLRYHRKRYRRCIRCVRIGLQGPGANR